MIGKEQLDRIILNSSGWKRHLEMYSWEKILGLYKKYCASFRRMVFGFCHIAFATIKEISGILID